MRPKTPLHHVVIIGGGFGGLYAAKALRGAPVRVTLVDRRNFHLFQPLLYQVATGGLSAGDISYPLRSIFQHAPHFSVIMAEVTDIDVAQRTILLRDGRLRYDTLIVAPGSTHQYFGHDDWATYAPALKTLEDALEIRRRIFMAFEAAEREPDPEKRRALMTFVIIGGGPTGGGVGRDARRAGAWHTEGRLSGNRSCAGPDPLAGGGRADLGHLSA